MAYSDGLAFIRTKYAIDERPDVCLVFVPAAISVVESGFRVLGISESYIRKLFSNLTKDKWIWSFSAFLLNPNSTGRFWLRSKDPLDDPLIEANFFRNDMDVKVLVEGIKTGISLSKTRAFGKFGSTIIDKRVSCDIMANFQFFIFG